MRMKKKHKSNGPKQAKILKKRDNAINTAHKTGPIRILTACDSVIGTRAYQQDALFVSKAICTQDGEDARAFAILCDGMGGMNSGEETSRMVVAEMWNGLETMPCRQNPVNIAAFFVAEIKRMDALIVKGRGAGFTGTTMVAAYISANRLFWGAIGDSRIYLIRRGEIAQVTRDHNYSLYLKEDVEKRRITQEEANTHPKRDALVSFIGSGRTELIDANTEPFLLENGDMALLCSDGLTKSLTDDAIKRLVSTYDYEIKKAAVSLTRHAINIEPGPKDNTSVILMKYMESEGR